MHPLQIFSISLERFQDFRKCWACSLLNTLVTVTDNFWIVCGLIDGFNESHRYICYGVGKTSYELMSSILFCTTPKGCLLQHSHIFRKPELLGTEMKNLARSRLGNMLHLETQKGKEATKTLEFQKYLRGTAAYMKRLLMDIKGVVK